MPYEDTTCIKELESELSIRDAAIHAKDMQISSLKKLVTDMFTHISNYGHIFINTLKAQGKDNPINKEESVSTVTPQETESEEGALNNLIPSFDMLDGYEDSSIEIKRVRI